MCYGTQLIEFDDSFVRENQRLKQRMKRFWAQQQEKREKRFYANAFARPMWPVITAEQPDEAQEMQWGLVPAWAGDPKEFLKKALTFNAISDTAFDKPSFRSAMKAGRRCLVPVTGFYEWHHIGKVTYPHFIKLKSREEPPPGLVSIASRRTAIASSRRVRTRTASRAMLPALSPRKSRHGPM